MNHLNKYILILTLFASYGCTENINNSSPQTPSYDQVFKTLEQKHHVIFKEGGYWMGWYVDSALSRPLFGGYVIDKVHICEAHLRDGAPSAIRNVPLVAVIDANDETCRSLPGGAL